MTSLHQLHKFMGLGQLSPAVRNPDINTETSLKLIEHMNQLVIV